MPVAPLIPAMQTTVSTSKNLEHVDDPVTCNGSDECYIGEGGKVVNGENVGIGSTAHFIITGNSSANILIGGFDNDAISGGIGNDLLMGGNLNYLNNPNLVGIVNNGMDNLVGI